MLKRVMFLLCVVGLAATFALSSQTSTTQTSTTPTSKDKAADKVRTADVRDLEKQARMLDEQSAKEPNDKTFELLSKQLGVPVATLQSEKQSTSFGFGQLFIANALASSSGKTFDQIAKEFQQGQGWGQIAAQNGVKLGSVVSQMKSSNKALGHQVSDQQHGASDKEHGASGQSHGSQGAPAGGAGRPTTTGRGTGRGRG